VARRWSWDSRTSGRPFGTRQEVAGAASAAATPRDEVAARQPPSGRGGCSTATLGTRWLLDNSPSPHRVALCRDAGYDTRHVRDQAGRPSTDEVVLELARHPQQRWCRSRATSACSWRELTRTPSIILIRQHRPPCRAGRCGAAGQPRPDERGSPRHRRPTTPSMTGQSDPHLARQPAKSSDAGTRSATPTPSGRRGSRRPDLPG
jgi:hypothetical protein